MSVESATATSARRSLPAGVWALGFVSLLMDASSELVHSLLPVFMTAVLGASMATIGIVEGIAEATAAVTKVVSGGMSDRLRRRKPLVVLGYALAAATKPMFPLATSVVWVFVARFADRVGKGIRGAPRDALVADITEPALRGAAYGLRQALDSVGAFVGPLAAIALMWGLAGDLQAVLWAAVVPAALAVGLLVTAVHEPEPASQRTKGGPLLTLGGIGRLPAAFWTVVLLGTVFTLARFSEAFLVLRAQDLGLSLAYVPAVLVAMNVVYAGAAYPAGALADRFHPRGLLCAGLLVLVLADVMLAAATAPVHALIGAAAWGLHMALTQGLLLKLVADAAPTAVRGFAFGLFNLVTGVALLFASVIAGALWTAAGPAATFAAGAGFALLALAGVLVYRRS